jgi:hypothetical protein
MPVLYRAAANGIGWVAGLPATSLGAWRLIGINVLEAGSLPSCFPGACVLMHERLMVRDNRSEGGGCC